MSVWLLYRQKIFAAGFVAGLGWFFIHAHWAVGWDLPPAQVKQPVEIVGTITEIPNLTGTTCRLILNLDRLNGQKLPWWARAKVRLSWRAPTEKLELGDKLSATVRLKPPHGFANEGGFNYQKYLLLKGIRATGYIDGRYPVRRLERANRWRQNLFDEVLISTQGLEYRDLLLALTLGEKQLIEADRWQIIRSAGISHLLAISGLHIGVVFLFGLLLGQVLLKVFCWVFNQQYLVHKTALLSGFGFALVYAWLAGFSLPTVRALLMLGVFVLMSWRNRRPGVRAVLLNVLFIILLVDPLSILQPGLWLSFVAVMTIILTSWWLNLVMRNSLVSRLKAAFLLQCALFCLMLPLTLGLFNALAMGAVPINLIAVPWVSFTTVPLSLLAVVCQMAGLPGRWLFDMADVTLRWLFDWISLLDGAGHWLGLPFLPWYTLLLATLFVVALLVPLSAKTRGLSFLLLLPSAWALVPLNRAFEVNVLDVGQGLSVAIVKGRDLMVYDLGPVYPSGFNTAEQVLLPYMNYRGFNQIDRLVISHRDSDHSGAWRTLYRQDLVRQWMTPAGLVPEASACRAGAGRWQGLDIQVLWPLSEHQKFDNTNDSSCVIRISDEHYSVLLTGDISAKVERRLVERYGRLLHADVLIAPHHGSRFSSTGAFVDAVAPSYVVFSSGFYNRYGFPNPAVVARYQSKGALVLNTADVGRVGFSFAAGQLQVDLARNGVYGHWYDNR